MKKFVIILILSFSSIYAQDKKPKNLPLIKSIVENFNSSNYDQIYSMFNDRLKNEVESDIVLKFFSDVKGFHGTIKNFEFVKYDKGMNGEITTYNDTPGLKHLFIKDKIEFNNIKYNYYYVVYDIIGREMMRGAINNGNDQIALNGNLKNGVYEVVLENENIILSSKFILKNNSAL